MAWTVRVKEEALKHLQWFGKKTGRKLLEKALEHLEQDPLANTKNLKTLRPNRVAARELRLFGAFRVLFSVEEDTQPPLRAWPAIRQCFAHPIGKLVVSFRGVK